MVYSRKGKNRTKTFEETLLEFQEKFENFKSKHNKISKLLSDVIGFYNREQKPQWRQHLIEKIYQIVT